jgi:rare lipoprotein A
MVLVIISRQYYVEQNPMTSRLLLVLFVSACAGAEVEFPLAEPTSNTTMPSSSTSTSSPASIATSLPAFTQEGLATYYADSLHGRKTASGEPYDKTALTCAHKKLPFGTYLLVESLTNGKSVIVRVNDRGPFVAKRIIDVSRAAAEQLDLLRAGVMKVRITEVAASAE